MQKWLPVALFLLPTYLFVALVVFFALGGGVSITTPQDRAPAMASAPPADEPPGFGLSCRNGVKDLFVRDAPSRNGSILGRIPPGATLQVLWGSDTFQTDSGGSTWRRVRYETGTGRLLDGWSMTRSVEGDVYLLSAGVTNCAADFEEQFNRSGVG